MYIYNFDVVSFEFNRFMCLHCDNVFATLICCLKCVSFYVKILSQFVAIFSLNLISQSRSVIEVLLITYHLHSRVPLLSEFFNRSVLNPDELVNASKWTYTVSTTRDIVVNETLNTTETTTHIYTHTKYIFTNDAGLVDRIRNVGENKYVYRVNI